MADHAPVAYFVNRLRELRTTADGAVTERNVAVGGSFDHEVVAQYAGAAGKPYDIAFLGLAMNSGTVYGVNSRGPNAAFTRNVLKDFLVALKGEGVRPIVCNTIHMWPEKATPAGMAAALVEGIAYPPECATLFQHATLTFDAARGEITVDPALLSSGPGRFVQAGSQLRIRQDGGANSGQTMVVAARVSESVLRVQPGDIKESGTFWTLVQHYAPPAEEILVPPPSQQLQNKDWTGNGVAVDGLYSFSHWNGMLRELCEEVGVLMLDIEYRGFRWVEKHGWESVYVSTYAGQRFETFNHPQHAAQSVIYGDVMREAAERYQAGTLPNGFAVLRGPEIA